MLRLPTNPFKSLCARNLPKPSPRPAIHASLFKHAVNPSRLQGRVFSLSAATRTSALSGSQTMRSNAFRAGKNSFIIGRGALIGLAGLSLGLAAFQIQRPPVLCDAPQTLPSPVPTTPKPELTPLPPTPPPPQSSLRVYELGFGTVAGFCAGVFVKKGAKALAFVLGGVFVLLQYLVTLRLVRVNWSSAETRFSNLFYARTKDVGGEEVRQPPTVVSLWRWLVDFLTADFQPRATFIAGLALGLRVG